MNMRREKEQEAYTPEIPPTTEKLVLPEIPTTTEGLVSPEISPTGEELVSKDDLYTPLSTKKSLSPFQESIQRFRGDKRAMSSLGVLLFLMLLALIGPPIYKQIGGTYQADLGGTISPDVYHSYDHQELTQQNQGPSARYWLGTDALGRDLLARLMQGMLVSFSVALVVEAVDIGIGVIVGLLAGSGRTRKTVKSYHSVLLF